jgi:hypothetical protein
MLTVMLKSDVAEQISQLAGKTPDNTEDFVDKALRAYLVKLRQEKLIAESNAFDQQHETLLARYQNEYVAVHQGLVFDHDPDLRTLHLRVFARLGHTPVLLKRVTDEPQRELVFRSPRLERGPA